MVLGHNMSVARNSSGYTGLILNRPVLSPLGGGLLPASWITRRQLSRNQYLRELANQPVGYGFYISRSSSFGGVGTHVHGGRGAAFRRGLYVHH